jgi:hypothetical protein
MQLVEQIKNSNGQIMAIIISHRFNEKGIHFFTPDEFSQQLAYMNHPKGKIIDPHYHNAVQRNVVFTQEVLIIKKGKLKVDFFDDALEGGDTILLSAGGHGFEVIEDVEMIEVKQGPYQGEADKTRFIKKA